MCFALPNHKTWLRACLHMLKQTSCD